MNPFYTRLLVALTVVSLVIGCKPKSTSHANSPSGFKSDVNSSNSEEVEFKAETLFKSTEGISLVNEFNIAVSELSKVNDRLILLAKCGDFEGKGPERIERVKNPDSWPDDRQEMYVFLLDSSNRIRFMQIVPNSESGDWYEQNDYLFDPDGSLRYWERYYGSFIPDEPSKTWQAYAWSKNGRVLDHATKFIDTKGHAWKGAKPTIPPLPPLKLKVLIEHLKLAKQLEEAKVKLP